MRTLVFGGAACGKSALAERLCRAGAARAAEEPPATSACAAVAALRGAGRAVGDRTPAGAEGVPLGRAFPAPGVASDWPGAALGTSGSAAPLVYIATMEPFGPEAAARIERHQALRAGAGFSTLECPCDLAALALPAGAHVLLEGLGTLVANELYAPPDYAMRLPDEALARVLAGVAHLEDVASGLTVVSDDVFADGVAYSGQTQAYLDVLARVNAALAGRFERVVEVVCGLSIWHKGEEGERPL